MAKCKNCNWFALDSEHKEEYFCCFPLATDIAAAEAEIDRDCQMFSQMSNADKIRAMSDEELAEFINRKIACDCCSAKHCNSEEHCTVDILQWLKSEVKE